MISFNLALTESRTFTNFVALPVVLNAVYICIEIEYVVEQRLTDDEMLIDCKASEARGGHTLDLFN